MASNSLLSPSMWFSVGARRRPQGIYYWVFTPFAVAVGIYVISAATYIIIAPWALTVLFFSGMAALGFLTTGAFEHSISERPTVIDVLLALLSVAAGIYFGIKAPEIVERIVLLDELTDWDVFFASLVFLLTIEVTRRSTGLGLTALVLVFVAYNLWGHNLEGVLQHGKIDYLHFIEITVFTTDGIFGLPLRVAATYAFMFVMFGTLLQACKGSEFFFDFAAAIAGRRPGGPAKVAVISSGMYGMVSGSPTSDVVTTGSITIPIMKRLGYRGAYAGAIEVAASTGGSIVPPVLGTAAFIMVDFAGVEYRDIAIAAFIPAILYYVSIYSQVHFSSLRLGFGSLDPSQIPRFLTTMKNGGLFFVPLVILTVALLQGYTPTMVGVFGSLAVLAVSLLKAETRIGLFSLVNVLSETCYRMVPVAGACAAAGLVIGGITMTGLAGKFAHVVYGITEAHMFSTLLLTAAVTIVLGMGMPTPSAYILGAALMAPILTELDISTMAAHMFILYYAVMSALTPPVAVAAYAAASIAEDNPLYIALLAVKFAIGAFLIPFAFVYGPELLMDGPLISILITAVTAAVGLIVLAAALEAYMFAPLNGWTRVLLAILGLGMIAPNLQVTGVSAVILVALFGVHRLRQKAKP
ncbi:MAG: TRAP transporter fused permease subunit [Rhodospirillales bacterium]|nr:TRAP transporter fused permease subunit [Rhodospirillales bacterium]MDP6646416.1 TRAP transporter fused permease subunit [Rhodospirillales bacterium]MDP6841054.1 TRAP transporter fused permease subunit [Rhodospirillales bacterium]